MLNGFLHVRKNQMHSIFFGVWKLTFENLKSLFAKYAYNNMDMDNGDNGNWVSENICMTLHGIRFQFICFQWIQFNPIQIQLTGEMHMVTNGQFNGTSLTNENKMLYLFPLMMWLEGIDTNYTHTHSVFCRHSKRIYCANIDSHNNNFFSIRIK